MRELGWFLVFAGLLVLVISFRDVRRLLRMTFTRTKKIQDIGTGDHVEIVGRIVCSEAGTFAAPLSKAPVVWCRVQHEAYERSGSRIDWYPSDRGEKGVPFLVDDGSGVAARVLPEGMVVRNVLPGPALSRAAPDEVHAFLDQHAKRGRREPLDTKFLPMESAPSEGAQRWIEDAFRAGDPIYLIGAARRGDDGVPELFAGNGELFAAFGDESKASFRMRGVALYALMMIAIGAGMLICKANN